MSKQRLEAFSDGVMAILITIMVLELRVPHSAQLDALVEVLPTFLSYVLSFVYLGIYWNNHHHMLHAARHVTGGVLWANLHLLFWLSLLPFATAWMGENHFAPVPTAFYGVILLACAMAYLILERALIAADGPRSELAKAVHHGFKEKISPFFYIAAIPIAFVNQYWSDVLFVAVALIWVIPDRRIERLLKADASKTDRDE
jgi:TMEM175 potassium channel family protein